MELEIPYGFQAEEYHNLKGRPLKNAAKKMMTQAKKKVEQVQKKVQNLENKVKKVQGKTQQKIQTKLNNAKKTLKKVTRKIKKIRKPFARFNPNNAASRAAALVALRQNSFGVSTRLAPAFIADSGFSVDAKSKALPKWNKVKKVWDTLGGNQSKLEDAIRKGYKKKPIKQLASKVGFKKYSSVEGEEEFNDIEVPEEAREGLQGMPIIGTIIKIIKGLLNPFKRKEDAPEGFNDALTDGDEFATDEDIPEVSEDGSLLDEDGDPIEKEEIMGIPKTAFYLGTTAVVIIGGIFGTAFIIKAMRKPVVPVASGIK